MARILELPSEYVLQTAANMDEARGGAVRAERRRHRGHAEVAGSGCGGGTCSRHPGPGRWIEVLQMWFKCCVCTCRFSVGGSMTDISLRL